jgi:hypothetical protein
MTKLIIALSNFAKAPKNRKNKIRPPPNNKLRVVEKLKGSMKQNILK